MAASAQDAEPDSQGIYDLDELALTPEQPSEADEGETNGEMESADPVDLPTHVPIVRLVPGTGEGVLPEDVQSSEARPGISFAWSRPVLGETRRQLLLSVEVTPESIETDAASGRVKEVWGSVNGGPWGLLTSSAEQDQPQYWLSLDSGDFSGGPEIVLSVYAIDEDGYIAIAEPYQLRARDEDAASEEEDGAADTEADHAAEMAGGEVADSELNPVMPGEDDAVVDLRPGRFARYDGQPSFQQTENAQAGGGVSINSGGGGAGAGSGGIGSGGSGGSGGGGGGGGGAPPATPESGDSPAMLDVPDPPVTGDLVSPNEFESSSDPEPEATSDPAVSSFDHVATGVSGRVVGRVIVLSGVDYVTWSSDRYVQLLYGAQLGDGLAAAPSRNAAHTDLAPYLGGTLYSAIPTVFRNAYTGYVLLGTSPGVVRLQIWSKAQDAAAPIRTEMNWTALVSSSIDPAIMQD